MMRSMELTVLSTDGSTLPTQVTVSVPKNGEVNDLIRVLTTTCSLGDDETLLLAEIYFNHTIVFLDALEAPLELYGDEDDEIIVAYRLLKDEDSLPLVAFIHSSEGKFGIPLVARIPEGSNDLEMHKKFLKLLQPFRIQGEFNVDGSFRFQRTHAILAPKTSEMVMNEELLTPLSRKFYVFVTWPDEMLKQYDASVFSHLPPTTCEPPEEDPVLKKCVTKEDGSCKLEDN